MRNGRHYIDSGLGIGMIIGLIVGLLLGGAPGGWLLMVFISAFLGAALAGGKLRFPFRRR
jgi:hypothetical protein